MEDKEKMSGSDYVDNMAELGMKHGKILTRAIDAVQEELTAENSDEKVKDVHPIYINAGQGAYEGALRIALGKRARVFDVFSSKP